jgi:hypothetical protein
MMVQSPSPCITTGHIKNIVHRAVQRLIELNINLLAIDFDLTFIDIHTGGRWLGTEEELREHVRVEMCQLIRTALSTGQIRVTIVTFSIQTQLVRSILENVFGSELASQIPIRGADRSWNYEGKGIREGKQHYIASAVEELQQKPLPPQAIAAMQHLEQQEEQPQHDKVSIVITKNSTVLIDDDPKNIRIALGDGTRAVWFNVDKPHHLLQELVQMV